MATDKEKDRTELRTEINIAIYWRKLIGDFEYIKFDPDDMLRWYLAMDMRGEPEIREHMAQRYAMAARRVPVLGLVGEAPHPPAWIVREWLETQRPKFPTWRIFGMSVSFVILAGTLAPMVHSCNNMQTLNPLAYNPPNHQPSTQMPSGTDVATALPMASSPIKIAPINSVVLPVSGVLSGGNSPPVSQAQMGRTLSLTGTIPGTGATGAANIGITGGAGATHQATSRGNGPP